MKLSKRILSCFLSFSLVVTMMCGLFVVEAGAWTIDRGHEHTITVNEASAAVAWAKNQVGASNYHYSCYAFINDVFHYWAGFSYYPMGCAHDAAVEWTYSTNTSVTPPLGALCFYDCYLTIDGIYANYGHIGISDGLGNVVHAWDTVVISDYKITSINGKSVSQDTSTGGLKYIGWGTWRNYNLEYNGNNVSPSPVDLGDSFTATIKSNTNYMTPKGILEGHQMTSSSTVGVLEYWDFTKNHTDNSYIIKSREVGYYLGFINNNISNGTPVYLQSEYDGGYKLGWKPQ